MFKERRGLMNSLKKEVSKSGNVSTLGKLRTIVFIFSVLFLILNVSPVFSATCTPISAQLCAAVDDWSQIFINGNLVTNASLPTFPGVGGVGNDGFPYCNVGAACSPMCISLNATQLGWLKATGNVISVRTLNTGYAELWTSYSLDVVCSGGGHSYVSSADLANMKMYYDSACPDGDIPQYGGRNWYDPLYNWSSSGLLWTPPFIEDGQKYGQRLMDPQTGNLLPAISYATDSNTNDNDCKEIFIRHGFDLPIEPTPAPPDLSITKSVNPASNYGQTTPYDITFTLHICNAGGGTAGNPVTISDNWADSLDNFDWQWPNSNIYDTVFGEIDITRSGKTMSLLFKDGFPSNSCYDFKYALKPNGGSNNNTGAPNFCEVWHNIADLSYLAQPVKEAIVTINNFCPPPPNLTLVKSANITTLTGKDQQFSFNLQLCNTGGAAWSGDIWILDDYSSYPGVDIQCDNPYNQSNPAPGIIEWKTTNPTTRQRLYQIRLQQPGFTGCIDLPDNMKTGYNWGCGPWHNDATLQSYMGLPTVVSKVNMLNLCSPTFTPTFTLTVTPSKTMTLTYTYTYTKTATPSWTVTNTVGVPSSTFTRTLTQTYTRTQTPTYTITPQPTMNIIKTANVGIATFGDIITYTLSYHNTGSVTANPVCIYDTVPAQITYINSSLAPTTGAPNLVWCIGSVASGGLGTITWWGKITSYPLNPLFNIKMYLGEIMIYKKEIITTYREYQNQSLVFLDQIIRK